MDIDVDSFDPKTLTKTFGSNIIGTFVASVLYGFTCFFAVRYYRQYSNDRLWFKYMVGCMWLLDTLQTVFSMHYCYYYLVIHFMDPGAMQTAIWSLKLTVLITSFPPLISNSFYLSRLWKIGQRNVFLIGGIGLLILGRLGVELASSILLYIHPVLSDFSRYRYLIKIYCSISSVSDLLLALFITLNLYKRRTGFKRSDKTIDLIVVYILSTGILTSVVCLLSLFSTIFVRHGLVDIALHGVLGKLYILSVLAVLNSRQAHNKRNTTIYEVSAFGVDSSAAGRARRSMVTSGTFTIGGGSTMANPESQRSTLEVPRKHLSEKKNGEEAKILLQHNEVGASTPT